MRSLDKLRRLDKTALREWLDVERSEFEYIKDRLVDDPNEAGAAKYLRTRIRFLEEFLEGKKSS